MNTEGLCKDDRSSRVYTIIRRVDAVTHLISTVAGGATIASQSDGLGDGGPATSAILNGPQSVAVDSSGNLYIADAYHQLVRTVNASTGIISVVAGGGTASGTDGFGDGEPATTATLSNPFGVALDGVGNLYIVDSGNNLIRRVNLDTGYIVAAAGNGSWGYSGDYAVATSASLATPQAVAVDAAGNLYIADYGNNAIRQVNWSSGIITTIVGRGSTGYNGDGGNPTAAFLTNPMGVALDENGNFYIGDTGNNVIRQVSVAPSPLSFPTEPVGALSSYQLVSPMNIGNQSLTFGTLAISPNFEQVQTGTVACPSGSTLTIASLCNIAISFAPSQTGSLTGTLQIPSNSLNNAGSSSSVSLSGTAASGSGPVVSLTPTLIVFPPPDGWHRERAPNRYPREFRRCCFQHLEHLP